MSRVPTQLWFFVVSLESSRVEIYAAKLDANIKRTVIYLRQFNNGMVELNVNFISFFRIPEKRILTIVPE